jgi:hypothetical protein
MWKILLYNITSKYTKKISFWVGRSLRVLKRRRRGEVAIPRDLFTLENLDYYALNCQFLATRLELRV